MASNEREQDLFLAALERPPAQRESFLRESCPDDEALRARVLALLAAHDRAGRFLSGPAEGSANAAPPDEQPGQRIGRYKLLQRIGEGGFGAVWMAEQEEPVRRQVALKIIKRGMDSKQVVARFEAERQALAMMDHPNIAKVFDGGQTPAGLPYFVMELVRGVPITRFCDEQHLDSRERLELFTQVCHAVQHAHQKGVIHRDLKPSNVMVTLHDTVPVVKVIDFGIAKAIHQRLTDKTMFTEFQQMIGTPEYMSPEQAELSGLDIDTRADVYSLGILLYELLTGSTPFARLRERGMLEMLRVIREEDPPRPSTAISTLGDAAPAVAKNRRVEPGRLQRLVAGDLDWIVMKTLEKDRARRYATALELAADLRRHLECEPVLACPPSRGYRLRKFVRKRRALVTGATAVSLSLVVGFLSTSWMYFEAEESRRVAVNAQGLADRAADDERQARLAAERAQVLERRAREDAEDQTRRAEIGRLGALALSLAERSPQQATLLAAEAVQTSRRQGERHLTMAESALRRCLAVSGGLALTHPHPMRAVAMTRDEKTLIASDTNREVHIWELAADGARSRHRILRGFANVVVHLSIDADGSSLAAIEESDQVSFFDLRQSDPETGSRRTQEHFRGVSANGRWLVTGDDEEETLSLWDLTTRRKTHSGFKFGSLRPGSDKRRAQLFAVHPDGDRLGYVDEKLLAIYDLRPDVDRRLVLKVLDCVPGGGYRGLATCIEFSPDGTRLATACANGTIQLWDCTEIPRPIRQWPGRGVLPFLAFDPTGRSLAAAYRDGTVALFPLAGGEERVLTVPGPALNGSSGTMAAGSAGMRFCGSGEVLATLSEQGRMNLWSLARNDAPCLMAQYSVTGAWLPGSQLAFGFSGRRLVISDEFGTALWVDVDHPGATGDPVSLLPSGEYLAVAISSDSRHVVAARKDEVLTWRVSDDGLPVRGRTLQVPGSNWDVAVARGGDRIVGSTIEGKSNRAWVWDARRPEEAPTVVAETQREGDAVRVLVSPDGRYLVLHSLRQPVQVFDLEQTNPRVSRRVLCASGGEALVQSGPASVGVSACVFVGPDSLIGAFVNGEICRWSLDSRTELPTATFAGGQEVVDRMLVSSDGRWLAAAKPLRLWDLQAGIPTARVITKSHRAISFSLDGRWLAADTFDGPTLWPLGTDGVGEAVPIGDFPGTFDALDFSADGDTLIGTSLQGMVFLWNLNAGEEGRQWVELRLPDGEVGRGTISPDRRILYTSSEGNLLAWRLRIDDLLDLARKRVGRNLSVEEWQKHMPETAWRATLPDLPTRTR